MGVSIYVDGTEAEPKLVGNCMISVELTQGEHTVQLRYKNQAFSLGWKVSLLSAVIFGGISWYAYRPELEKRKKKQA